LFSQNKTQNISYHFNREHSTLFKNDSTNKAMAQLAPLHSTIPTTKIRKVSDTKTDTQKPKNAALASGTKSKPKRKTTTGKFDTGHPHQTQTEINAFYNHLSWYSLQPYAHNSVQTPNYTPNAKLLFQNSHQSHPSTTTMAHHIPPTGKLTKDEYFKIASVLKAQTKLAFTPAMIRSMNKRFTTAPQTETPWTESPQQHHRNGRRPLFQS
jgi:hypothetical protein